MFVENINKRSPVFLFAFTVLFITIFDSAMQYVTPLIIQERGFSASMIGIILGISSIAGAFFDFIICKIFKNTDFRRVLLVMFAICFIYPLLLWQAKTVWFFIFVMAVWGIYFDLYGFGIFNFISRYTKKEEHSLGFGLVEISKSVGDIIGPFVIGFVIVSNVDWKSFSMSWVFLGIGFLLFLVLTFFVKKKAKIDTENLYQPRRKSFFIELHLWKKIGKIMSPVLVLTFYLFFIEAFFWTLGPLYAESSNLKQFGGLFLSAYAIPAIITGLFISPLTKKFGKKKIAFVGLLLGSLVLSLFFTAPNSILAIILVFIASCFISLSLPAINAVYAGYISESPQVEGEIESLEDFSFNIGYVLGPILAGVLADFFNIPAAFGILGILGMILATVLLMIAPKHVKIKTRQSEL